MPPKAKLKIGKVVKASKKAKVSFIKYEADLLLKYGSNLELPKEFIDLHTEEFIKGVNHVIKVDPTLYPIIVLDNFNHFTKKNQSESAKVDQDFFRYLIKSIISQQVSGAAAKSIENKFLGLFNDEFPTPQELSRTKDEDLRKVGISIRKCSYFKSTCDKFINKELSTSFFQNATNEEIIDRLVEIKGVGPWTANMFLMFALNRMDVFTSDDLGIARGFSRYLENRSHLLKNIDINEELLLKRAKFHDNKQRDWAVYHDSILDALALLFKPYRTVLMLVLWRASSTNIEALT